jgi:hypothetical protein
MSIVSDVWLVRLKLLADVCFRYQAVLVVAGEWMRIGQNKLVLVTKPPSRQ